MICVHCSTPVADEAKFCHSCGSMVSDAEGQALATASMDQSAFAHMEKMLRDETAGEFVVGKLLGRGGMAVVYLAEETRLGRKVALKVLPPELTFGHGVERFLREAKTAATLDHPHIIPIYRIASGGKLFWYAMKYLEGRSLDDVLKERGAYSLEETIGLLEQVADALDYAHERKVIHRDIKPANVMLDQRDRVIITDFGIAKALTEGALTASGSVIGTPYFMSPEQGMGKPVAGAADQYSVAVMAFRMLAGHLPFDGDSAIDILHKHCMMEPPRLDESMPHLPEHVVAAVEKGMAKKADERFPNIKSLVAAMKDPSVKFSRPSAKTVLIDSGEVEKANAAGLKKREAAKKSAAASAARTVVAQPAKGARPAAAPSAPAPKSRVGLWVAIVLLAVGGSGFGVWKVMDGKARDLAANPSPQTQTAADAGTAGAPANSPTSGTPPVTDPTPTDPSAPQKSVAPPPVTSAADREPTTRTPPSQTRRQTATPPQTRPAAPQSEPVAATPPAAAAEPATLQLILPTPGNLFIDAVPKGEKSRTQEQLRAGAHQIRVERDGFATIDTVITFAAGETKRLTLRLVARP
jgi:serine/threonine-protein kinase